MPYHSNAPHDGGASRNCFDGSFRDNLTPLALQAQHLIGVHRVRPELAPIVASLAFGGGGRHG